MVFCDGLRPRVDMEQVGRACESTERERTHASGRWLGTKQQGGCAVGCISSPKGETSRGSANQHCLPQAARSEIIERREIDCRKAAPKEEQVGRSCESTERERGNRSAAE